MKLTSVWPRFALILFLGISCNSSLQPEKMSTATLALISSTTTTLAPSPVPAPTPQPQAPHGGYEIGNPTLTELYLSPGGNDENDGLSLAAPLRTLTAAWNKIPAEGVLTSTGYRLNFLPGVYPCEPAEPENCQNYFADRLGSYQFPVILRAYDGPRTVTLRGGFDLNHVAYLYLIDLTLAGGTPLPTNQSWNNLLHLANADHVLLRGMTLDGPNCDSDACNNLQETFKVNQAQYLYVENSQIGGAWHSAVDYFSVQYGHFLNNHLHTAGQWCMYLKGGSSYLRIEGNELGPCHLGFQAGQSSNLTVMRPPWLHYETYDIKFINNVLHDLPGVGLSVSGGYNILLAYNTLYNVATAAPGYALLQAVQGERGCGATDEFPDPAPVCIGLLGSGAWGPNFATDNLPAIPNRNVYIYNNLIYNPAPAQTLYTHLNIQGPIARPAGFQNLPDPIVTDQNLVIAGNLIWNGPLDHPLGVDDTTGCASTNPTCNAAQLAANNTINGAEPLLIQPSTGDYHPAVGSAAYSAPIYALPAFTWDSFSPSVPAGTLTNAVSYDRDGLPRTASDPPGAYASSTPRYTHALYAPLIACQ